MNTLKIAGINYPNIYVDSSLSYNKPEKNRELISIPGRSGDLVVDHGTWKNVPITYPCYAKDKAEFDWLIYQLASIRGYAKIECTDDTDHFRMGVPIIPQAPTVKRGGKDFYFDLNFNCKPQRFLTTGAQATDYTANATIYNPKNETARPIIVAYAAGSFKIEEVNNPHTEWTITVSSYPAGYLYGIAIDCETMECYFPGPSITDISASANQYVSISPNKYPYITYGGIRLKMGTMSKITIVPRWWEI